MLNVQLFPLPQPEKAKSMDAKSDIEWGKNQDKTPEIVDEPELSVEEGEEGRPPDGVTKSKTVSFSETVDTAEINVSTELDDTVEINELVVEENSDKVPTIKGGDIPTGECDGFYDLDSTLPCSQMPRIDLYKKHQN